MKLMKKLLCAGLTISMIAAALTACGGNSAYTGYSNAFKKTASVGSLDINFSLEVDDGDETVESSGNRQVNSDNEVYYEMEIGDTKITQYITDGTVHTIIDGQEQTSSTSDKGQGTERANPEDGKGAPNDKEDNSGFNSKRFLEEFSGLLEAGKIKDTGVLDPIASRYIKNITKEKKGSDTVYTLTFPDEFQDAMLDKLTDTQTGNVENALTFSELKDFKCVCKENSKGYLYEIEYSGYTTVTVPGELMNNGKEETFDLSLDLTMEILNPGTAVEVNIPD